VSKMNEMKITELTALNTSLCQQKNDLIIKAQSLEREIEQH